MSANLLKLQYSLQSTRDGVLFAREKTNDSSGVCVMRISRDIFPNRLANVDTCAFVGGWSAWEGWRGVEFVYEAERLFTTENDY